MNGVNDLLQCAAQQTMKLSDTDLERGEREWAERVLSKHEELLLVLRPKRELFDRERVLVTLGGLFFMFVPVFALVQNEGNPDLANVLIPVVFMLAGLGVLVNPWWKYGLEKHSMYLVTSRRMVYLYLTGFRKTQTDVSYELRPNVQLEAVVEKPDGSGYIAFNYEDEDESIEYGGLLENVPQVQRVAELLQSSLNARQPDVCSESAEV